MQGKSCSKENEKKIKKILSVWIGLSSIKIKRIIMATKIAGLAIWVSCTHGTYTNWVDDLVQYLRRKQYC